MPLCTHNSPCITTMNFFSLWLLKLFLLDLVPFVAKLMDNWLWFVSQWRDWKMKDQSEKCKKIGHLQSLYKKFTLILILFKKNFGSLRFWNFKFGSRLHFPYLLFIGLREEKKSSISVIEREILDLHWFSPQKISILILMSSTRWKKSHQYIIWPSHHMRSMIWAHNLNYFIF